jgi:hypothetical protein
MYSLGLSDLHLRAGGPFTTVTQSAKSAKPLPSVSNKPHESPVFAPDHWRSSKFQVATSSKRPCPAPRRNRLKSFCPGLVVRALEVVQALGSRVRDRRLEGCEDQERDERDEEEGMEVTKPVRSRHEVCRRSFVRTAAFNCSVHRIEFSCVYGERI